MNYLSWKFHTHSIMSALLSLTLLHSVEAQSFRQEQARYPRVQSAITDKEPALKALCASKNLSFPPSRIFLRIFKHEKILEVWVKNDSAFTLLKEYPICALSGKPGPKRRAGDGQVPEGFYAVDAFNPNSSFHLSLRVNYPNPSDRILGKKGALGNNICIHGNCVTIGCIPITDDKIKEVYVLAVEARSAGQRAIPVHIFPSRMNESGMKNLRNYANEDTVVINFWKNLKQEYDYFELYKTIPEIVVNANGTYLIRR